MGVLKDLMARAATEQQYAVNDLEKFSNSTASPFHVGPAFLYLESDFNNPFNQRVLVEFPKHPYFNFTFVFDRDDIMREHEPTNYLRMKLQEAWLKMYQAIYIPPPDNIDLGEN